ncbi:MAG: uroporphyrinogen decarboxylase family protein [Oscillospiraceae bacterium]|nr:uroporphyrinogen decarboxylase family protein [Oscillospiraceae bacterium]
MNHRQRVSAVVRGQKPDRTPVAFSSHFPAGAAHGDASVEAHLAYFENSGIDICKVMNENQLRGESTIEAPGDLSRETVCAQSKLGIQNQAELIKKIADRLNGEAPVILTVHGPMVSVHHMSGRSGFFVDNLDFYRRCITEDPKALQRALEAATQSLCEMVVRCFEAGADGIYLAALGAQNGLFTDAEYNEIVRPFDLQVLEAAASPRCCNILHLCAGDLAVHRFADYPVDIVNWEFGGKNPTLAEGFALFGEEKTIMGGLNNHCGPLISGTPAQIEREVHDILTQAEGRRFILGAGCTLPTDCDLANLRAAVRACETFGR